MFEAGREHFKMALRFKTSKWRSVHGRQQGGKGEGHLPPLEFKKMTSYAAVLQNTLKFSLEPSALALDTLHFSLKRREKNAKNFVDLLYGAPKTCRLFKVSVILPPSGKISAGAHGSVL